MPKANDQAQNLLNDFKAVNAKAKDYLSELDKKIAAVDLKYARHLVKTDISLMKAAKTIMESKNK